MNIWRFIKKCLTDPAAAVGSAKLVLRSCYGQVYWWLNPNRALAFKMPGGGTLFLEPEHSFTHCFWSDTDRYEPDVKQVLQLLLQSGDTFIDCGANIGYFSVQAGNIVGKEGQVIAIEANPNTYKLLQHNLEQNHLGTPVHCAVASQVGEVNIFMPTEGDVYSSLRVGGLVTGDSIRSFLVKANRLDSLVEQLALSKVDVVKIDIEGGELDVLQSAGKLWEVYRPIFVVEYSTTTWSNFDASPQVLEQLIVKHNYVIRRFDLTSKTFVFVTEDIWLSSYINLILLPQEKLK